MNFKRYAGATLALFAFMFFYEWFVNGYLLSSTYQQTPQVWRDMSEMSTNMPPYLGSLFVTAVWLTFVFTQIYPEGGISKGLLFGIFFGVFAGILTASWYFWLPVSTKLWWSWLASGVFEGLGGGVILGSLYRK